ncbi:MAG: PEP-CTERM sorting domain-containing protein [Mariniblastus sp.]|nr:PEP-CTERM sorting domain-containing protein [Mariniblastus sp.]
MRFSTLRIVKTALFSQLSLLIASIGISSASADFIVDGFGLDSADQTVTFSEFSINYGTVITDQYSSLGIEFGSLSPTEGLYLQPNAGLNSAGLQNYFPDGYRSIELSFTKPVSEAAFAMVTNGGIDDFTALLNGNVVETASTSTARGWQYYGFKNIAFDQIRIDINNNHMRLDNVQFSSVPEPTSATLFGIGILAVAARRRRAS